MLRDLARCRRSRRSDLGDPRRCRHRRRGSAAIGRRRSSASADGRSSPRASSGSTSSDWIDAIVVAAPPDWEEPAILLAEELVASKVAAVVAGGATRAESVRHALAEVPDEALVVLVHDAARPLVDDAVIERRARRRSRRAATGSCPPFPLADTVKRVEGGLVVETRRPRRRSSPSRRRRRSSADRLRSAYAGDLVRGHGLRVAGRAGGRTDCAWWQGIRACVKVTTADDLELVTRLLAADRAVTVRAVFFDVGETLVDEERYWREVARAAGLGPHVVWAALGVDDRARGGALGALAPSRGRTTR